MQIYRYFCINQSNRHLMPTKNPYGNTYIADLPEPETISAEEILESIDNKSIDLVCVLGPTASGKTKYAVELARSMPQARRFFPGIRGRFTEAWISEQART